MKFDSTDPVEQFLIEVHRLCDRDGRIGGYRLGEDPPDELRIAKILVAKIAAMERKACVEVVDAAKSDDKDWDTSDWNQAVDFCASRIRARGQA